MLPPDLSLPELDLGVKSDEIVRLGKNIYGLKQAGHIWFSTLPGTLCAPAVGFTTCDSEPCLFKYDQNGLKIQDLFHVDDGIITTNNKAEMLKVFAEVNKE